MVITYNRRKQGLEYLKTRIGPCLIKIMGKEDLNLELHPNTIYQQMINDQEMETGQKSTLERTITEEQAMQNEFVSNTISKRLKELQDICQMILDNILTSLDDLPYGMRWIYKQLRDLATKTLLDATKDDIQALLIYFVFYRFINLAIVVPDMLNFDIEIPGVARKNLTTVSKVLTHVFNFREFHANEKSLVVLNDFIIRSRPQLMRYLDDLPRVEDPEDYFKVNRSMELTHQTKPMISISLHEIYNTHQIVAKHLDQVAPEKEDPLRQIMFDLGPPPEIIGDDDRKIQLTLTNRFKVEEKSEI